MASYKEMKKEFVEGRRATAAAYELLVKEKGIREHHTCLAKGYQTTEYDCWEDYNGKFGKGYIRRRHSRKSKNYHEITYFIKCEKD